MLSSLIPVHIDRDPVQPGRELLGIAQATQAPVYLKKCLLTEIPGILLVVGVAQDKVIEPLLPAPDQRVERIHSAIEECRDQLIIRHARPVCFMCVVWAYITIDDGSLDKVLG